MNIDDVVDMYFNKEMSTQEIAEKYETYTSKVVKLLKKHGYTLRTRSESQKLVLKNNKSKHPTKGTKRPESVKNAISEKNHQVWKNLSKKELKKRSKIGKEAWEKLPQEKKEEFLNKGQEAVRKAAKEGSLMEKYLYKVLKPLYNVHMHKKGLIANEKLEVDLYISDLNAIIEIDGPSHFEDLWGDGSLKRNIRADNEKTSLFLNKGFIVIRLKDLRKNKSKIYFKQSGEKVLELLESIKKEYPKDKYIEMEL